MQNNIIAIAGYKNSGKDVVSSMLQYLLNSPKIFHNYFSYKIFNKIFRNGKYKIISFAHPLKRTLAALLDIDIKLFDNRDFKENYYVYFPTLEITNKIYPNMLGYPNISEGKFSRMVNNNDLSFLKTNYITIRQLLQVFGTEIMRNYFGDELWILSTLKNKRNIIISDLRFKVEFEAIKNLGGTCILINRDICKPGNHVSEKEIQELYNNNCFDSVIDNNRTLYDLFNQLKNGIRNF